MTVLALYPRGDYAAERVAQWGKNSIGSRMCELLEQDEVRIEKIERALKDCGATTLCYFGHGKDDRWIASSNGGLRTVVESATCGTITRLHVIAIACLSGKQLGPALRQNDCGFLGFLEKIFWFANITRCEKALGSAISSVVNAVLDNPAVSEVELKALVREMADYYSGLAERGDDEADGIVKVLANVERGLTF